MLEHYCQARRDKKEPHRTNRSRAKGRQTPALLLGWVYPPQRYNDESSPKRCDRPPSKLNSRKTSNGVLMGDRPAPTQRDDISKIHGGWKGAMLARLRSIIQQADPKVVEGVKWKSPS